MGTVVVRMYNVGFGDAFLVTVPRANGRPWRMLVDCGVHSHGVGEHKIGSIVGDIIETLKTDDPGLPPRLDVVVATHRHRDHIIGFDDDRWHDVEAGEVWLPWVEDPDDPDAVALRNQQHAAAVALYSHFSAGADQGLTEFVLNSVTNDDAMWMLQSGFAGAPKRRYISGRGARAHPIQGVRGGAVYFLGPPRDEADLAAMNPPKAQRWLSGGAQQADAPAELFGGFAIPPPSFAVRYPHLTLEEKQLNRFRLDTSDAHAAASLLDRAVNNTSVVFLLQVGDAQLLFPGDAQWGAWRPLLDDPDVRALLARTTLYKVSHHGSHNGTPVEVATKVLAGVTSLVSVRPVANWGAIPKVELLHALREPPRRVVQSDEAGEIEGVAIHPDGLWKELTLST